MIKKEKIDNCIIDKNALVSCKFMGNITEICYAQKRNFKVSTRLLNKDEYINLSTGEILNCNHISNRSESIFQVGQSLKRLRDYINTNVVNPNNVSVFFSTGLLSFLTVCLKLGRVFFLE